MARPVAVVLSMLGGRAISGSRNGGLFFSAISLTLIALVLSYATQANALPSYARQTGQPCGTCHTDFAGLTPYGRLFKIQGYTTGGGPYRTTLFPGSDSGKYIPPLLAKTLTSPDSLAATDSKFWVPP